MHRYSFAVHYFINHDKFSVIFFGYPFFFLWRFAKSEIRLDLIFSTFWNAMMKHRPSRNWFIFEEKARIFVNYSNQLTKKQCLYSKFNPYSMGNTVKTNMYNIFLLPLVISRFFLSWYYICTCNCYQTHVRTCNLL